MIYHSDRFWPRIFLSAALFNFAMGIPIMFFPVWSYRLAYHAEILNVASTYRFWSDFGFTVIAIGIGYFFSPAMLPKTVALFGWV